MDILLGGQPLVLGDEQRLGIGVGPLFLPTADVDLFEPTQTLHF
jgi:hypothetical protein